MKILVICGVYAPENEAEVLRCSKGYAEQSANIFQRKLIRGIEENAMAYKVISAPLIGAYPQRYRKIRFRKFAVPQEKYQYVPFCNIWGLRNISRAFSLKRAVKKYLKSQPKENFLILVYCPHTPFLSAAIYAKELAAHSKVCLVVPDLPQYMNLEEKRHPIYDFFKKYDIRHMQHLIDRVDSFVLLTEPMKDALKVGDRPYIVAEGLVEPNTPVKKNSDDGIRRIVYTGKMNIRFGIRELIESFMKIKEKHFRLILCGDGDARTYVEEMAAMDPRIEYKGTVTAAQARAYVNQADVLVNPRPNHGEYTKYSFPSKNIEYLMTGKPVVAYMLDGMSPIYEKFLYVIPPSVRSFEDILLDACQRGTPKGDFPAYGKKYLDPGSVIRRIMNM